MSRAHGIERLKMNPVLYVFLLVGLLGLVAEALVEERPIERARVAALSARSLEAFP